LTFPEEIQGQAQEERKSWAMATTEAHPKTSLAAQHHTAAAMQTLGISTMERLLGFNQQVIDQALAVVGEHAAPGARHSAPPFAGPVGVHLRHVVEHYEALVNGLTLGVVDYDGRPRDRQLESSPTLARDRLLGLRQVLGQWTPDVLDRPVQVLGQGGITGDFDFRVASSVGRELVFLASHAVHHFALLAERLQRHGVPVPAHFGKAPGTVANEIATRRAAAPSDNQELSCLSLPLSA
jgi:hypothetical protein